MDDEIIIKDPTGKFKILRGGKFYDFTPAKKTAPAKRVEKKIADIILEKSGIRVAENLRARLAENVDAYFRDVRDKFETKSALVRTVASGGMGFSAEQADLVIKLIEENKGIKPDELAEKKPAGSVPAAGPAAPEMNPVKTVRRQKAKEMPAGVAEFVFSPADEAEIEAAGKKLPKQTAGLKPAEISKLINNIIRESGVSVDENGRKKLENILLTHFKDIRDGFETQETLFGLANSAGINLTKDDLASLLGVAKQRIGELGEKMTAEAVAEAQRAMEEERKKVSAENEKVAEEVKNKIDERWQQITKKTALPPIDVPPELIAPPAAMQARVSTVAPPKPSPPPEEPARAAPIPEPSRKIEPAGIIPPASVKRVRNENEPKPFQILKPATAPARRPVPLKDNRPRLDDIKYIPKLVGPVEELREMTMVDFRRLDNNPEVATAKIAEKIRLLEKDSLSQKIAGIKAWHDSEISKLYLEISRESISKGIPAGQIISLRLSAGRPALTEAEYKAVMNLNRVLRY